MKNEDSVRDRLIQYMWLPHTNGRPALKKNFRKKEKSRKEKCRRNEKHEVENGAAAGHHNLNQTWLRMKCVSHFQQSCLRKAEGRILLLLARQAASC